MCPSEHPSQSFLARLTTRWLALGAVLTTTRASRLVGVNGPVLWQSITLPPSRVSRIVTRFTGCRTVAPPPLGVSAARSALSGSLTPIDRWLVSSLTSLISTGLVLGTAPVRTQLPKRHLLCRTCRVLTTSLTAWLGAFSIVSDRNSFLTQPWWQKLTASLVSLCGAKAVWGSLPEWWPM